MKVMLPSERLGISDLASGKGWVPCSKSLSDSHDSNSGFQNQMLFFYCASYYSYSLTLTCPNTRIQRSIVELYRANWKVKWGGGGAHRDSRKKWTAEGEGASISMTVLLELWVWTESHWLAQRTHSINKLGLGFYRTTTKNHTALKW